MKKLPTLIIKSTEDQQRFIADVSLMGEPFIPAVLGAAYASNI